jgi:hypothetical protein
MHTHSSQWLAVLWGATFIFLVFVIKALPAYADIVIDGCRPWTADPNCPPVTDAYVLDGTDLSADSEFIAGSGDGTFTQNSGTTNTADCCLARGLSPGVTGRVLPLPWIAVAVFGGDA